MPSRPIDVALKIAKERGLNQTAFAAKLGATSADVSNWKKRGMPADRHLDVAMALGISVDALFAGIPNVVPAPIGGRSIPVISAIQAGMWCEIVDQFQPGDADEYLLTDLELSAHAFALTIRGDSMLPEFNPGDRVIIDPEVAPHPGDFVAAKNGEQEATFKKYRPRGMDAQGNMVFELVPLNDDYPTLRSDIQPIRIVGTMVEHRKYRRAR
ncbi:SOS response transcriptional repressor [Acidovorax sp. HMWF018]|uniref:LexA family protein n=1 Tax=Acidovorax sp. HMWF018 TaxID=2056855 RepID=UPI000D3B94F2|nr:SOS response transcriptional repressor [Acidovorax sp. HMWF018]